MISWRTFEPRLSRDVVEEAKKALNSVRRVYVVEVRHGFLYACTPYKLVPEKRNKKYRRETQSNLVSRSRVRVVSQQVEIRRDQTIWRLVGACASIREKHPPGSFVACTCAGK